MYQGIYVILFWLNEEMISSSLIQKNKQFRKFQIRNTKMTSEPIHITDEAFEKVVMQSPLPVIVDFWAPWCGPCKMIAPTLEKLAAEQEGKLIVAKINTDEHSEWMQKFGIQGIPTLLFVSGGKVVHRQVGALPERMLREAVTQFMEVISQG
jgi:thioredoxin 1